MLNCDALMSSVDGRREDGDGERRDGVGCGFAAWSYNVPPRKSANQHIQTPYRNAAAASLPKIKGWKIAVVMEKSGFSIAC